MKNTLVLIFVFSFIFLGGISYLRVKENTRAVIWSDAEGYYKYLPGLFILKDFHKLDAGSVWPYYNKEGEYIDKYSCGIAYFEFPFFVIGHLINHFNNQSNASDYYNSNYAYSIAAGGVFYSTLGLLFLFLTLNRDFNKKISILTIICVFFGTNLFHYTTKEMGISHVYSFFLFSFLLYFTPKFLKNPDFFRSLIMGICLGSIVLIRPTNIIFTLILFGLNVYTWIDLKTRFLFFVKNIYSIIIIVASIVATMFPQFLYWHEMTGNWIYYSYENEGFKYWANPKIFAVLFDTQNGLLLYSPMVLLMLIGTFYGIYLKKYSGPIIIIIFSLITYTFASWWAWWFGGAFGHRCYVEYYSILAIPFAGLLFEIYGSKSKLLKQITSLLLILFTVYSVRMSYLYTSIGGPWDGPDWRWNFEKMKWILSHFF